MDALLKKVKKSPSVTTQQAQAIAIGHEKLGEGWAENSDRVAAKDGIVFYLKYLGFTLLDEVDSSESYADGPSTRAVQRIIAMAKSEGKKLRKVALRVCCTGIQMTDIIAKETLADISIYRISFCTVNKTHDKVCAFIARNTVNETMVCHAFLCAKPKIAQAVTLTVWQSFNVAGEHWVQQQQQRKVRHKHNSEARTKLSMPEDEQRTGALSCSSNKKFVEDEAGLPGSCTLSCPFSDSFLDYSLDELVDSKTSLDVSYKDDSLEESFSKFAQIRGQNCVPSFSTDLQHEDVDDSVKQYMSGQRCFEEFSRTKSFEDLLSL